jgi:hypothetical protein
VGNKRSGQQASGGGGGEPAYETHCHPDQIVGEPTSRPTAPARTFCGAENVGPSLGKAAWKFESTAVDSMVCGTASGTPSQMSMSSADQSQSPLCDHFSSVFSERNAGNLRSLYEGLRLGLPWPTGTRVNRRGARGRGLPHPEAGILMYENASSLSTCNNDRDGFSGICERYKRGSNQGLTTGGKLGKKCATDTSAQ